MAPKETRISLVYYLKSEGAEGPVSLTSITRSIDVPYASSFCVINNWIFKNQPDGFQNETMIGINWLGRCMVRGIIEKQSASESKEGASALVAMLAELG